MSWTPAPLPTDTELSQLPVVWAELKGTAGDPGLQPPGGRKPCPEPSATYVVIWKWHMSQGPSRPGASEPYCYSSAQSLFESRDLQTDMGFITSHRSPIFPQQFSSPKIVPAQPCCLYEWLFVYFSCCWSEHFLVTSPDPLKEHPSGEPHPPLETHAHTHTHIHSHMHTHITWNQTAPPQAHQGSGHHLIYPIAVAQWLSRV